MTCPIAQPSSRRRKRGAPRKQAATPAAAQASATGAPRYKLITGPHDAEFERKVNEALQQGYQLQGPPSIASDGKDVVVAQVLLAPGGGH